MQLIFLLIRANLLQIRRGITDWDSFIKYRCSYYSLVQKINIPESFAFTRVLLNGITLPTFFKVTRQIMFELFVKQYIYIRHFAAKLSRSSKILVYPQWMICCCKCYSSLETIFLSYLCTTFTTELMKVSRFRRLENFMKVVSYVFKTIS